MRLRLLIRLICGVLCAGFALALSSSLEPPQYTSRIWRTQDGLPENRVQAIAQTAAGYLWVGTTGGLARFDGVRFVVYTRFNTPAMLDDNIYSLAVARDDSLWIGTDGGGLLHYCNGRFHSFGPRDGLTNEFVNTVFEDSRGILWAGTQRGLFEFNGKRFKRVDEQLHLTNISFQAIWESPNRGLLASGPAGLFSMAGGSLHFLLPPNALGEVYRIRETKDHALWLATNRGLKIIPESGKNPAPSVVKSHSKVLIDAITEDHAGNVWLGTRGNGLFVVHQGRETAFRAPDTLPDNSISALLEDRDGNIWVGAADGLARLSTPDVEIINSRNGLHDNNIATVYSDRRGTLWLTTITGKVYQYTHGRLQPFPLPFPANTLEVIGTYEDHSGAFWFGTVSQGVVRIAKGHATRFTMADGLRNNGIQALFEDHNGNVWIGTSSGLSRWDGTRFQNYYLEDGLSYGWIRSIAEDRNGDLLVGTDRGLNRLRNGKFVQDGPLAQLRHDSVWAIFQDAEKTLWIGTRGGGLVRIKNGQVSRLTTKEGLLSNSIFQAIGSCGRLWMSSSSGLSSASFVDLNSTADGAPNSLSVLSYAVGGGVEPTQMNEGFQPSACVTPDGALWFPSVKGAVRVNPKHRPSARPSAVRLESFLVDGKIVHPAKELVVGPGREQIEIEFTAIALRAPEQVSFRYRLEGFDQHWTAAAQHRVASYDNLPPGRYFFRVIAHNPEGSSEAGISLVVRPQFYQTDWFYALCFVLLGVAAAGAFAVRERQARNRYNLLLEERTRIARDMHDTVIQGCLGVSTLVEAAVGAASSDQHQMLECLDNARIHLRLTVDEARQALTELRHHSSWEGLEQSLSRLCRTLSAEKGIPVTLDVEGSPVPLPASTNRALLLIAREAIRNAVAHGDPSAVRAHLWFRPSELRLNIYDDGAGFTIDPAALAASDHFGILGMRERIEQIGGTLGVESCLGAGTTITAILPVITPTEP